MSENINEIAGVEPSFKMDELKFNEKGLIPAIVQDHYSKKVLMMAWILQPQPSGALEKGRDERECAAYFQYLCGL